MTYDEAFERLNNVLGDHVTRLNNFKLDKIAAAKNSEAHRKAYEDVINELSIGDITLECGGDVLVACYTPSKERSLQGKVRATRFSPNFENLGATRGTFHCLLSSLFGDIARRYQRSFAELSDVLGYLRLMETTITEEYRQSIIEAEGKWADAAREEKRLEKEQRDWATDVKSAMSALAEAWVMKTDFAPGDKISVFDQRSGRAYTKTIKRFVKTNERTTIYIENGGHFRIDDGHVYYLETWFLHNPSYKEILCSLTSA